MAIQPACGIKQWSAKEKDEEGKREVFWFECSTHSLRSRHLTRSARATALAQHKAEYQR